jgi:uncharacterized membrane protein YfcA
MEINIITVLITFFVTFIGGLIQGTVAFGMGIFIVISLAWMFPSLTLIPFVTLVSGVNLADMIRRRRVPVRSIFSPVLLFPSLLGVSLGTWLLVHLPDWGIKLTLGIVIFITGVVFTIRPPKPRADLNEINNEKREPWVISKAAVTFLGSILGGWISTAGPPMILYGYGTMPAEASQRYLVRAFLLGVTIKLFTYGYSGLWTREVLLWAGACLVFVLVGTAIGHHLAERLPAERLSRIAWVVFAVMGFLLLVRSLFQTQIG